MQIHYNQYSKQLKKKRKLNQIINQNKIQEEESQLN